MALIEAGAEEFEQTDNFIYIYTNFTDFGKMNEALERLNVEVKNSELQRIPLNTTSLPVAQAQEILDLIEKFEEDDDVQNVYHTLEVTEELLANIAD